MALTFERLYPIETSLVGVGLIIVPPRDTTTNIPWTGGIEVERAPDSGGSPGTWVLIATLDQVPPAGGRFIDDRPWTTSVWWYRYRPVRGGASGSYSAAVSATPGLFPRGTRAGFQTGDAAAFHAGVRGDPMSDGGYAVKATDNTGTQTDAAVRFDPANGVNEGGATHKIYRHREEITVQGPDTDGDVPVTFAATYQNVPAILLRGGQLVSFSNVIGTGVKQRQRIQPVNVTASGFTSRTQIASVGATTAQEDDFASGNLLDAVGETAEVNLDPAGANDDSYTVNYRVSVTVDENPSALSTATLVVAIDSNDGGGGGWIERATFSYPTSNLSGPPPFEANTATWNDEAKQIVVTGLGTNDDIRIRAKSFSVNNGGTGSFAVRGADGAGSNPDTRRGVLYTTASDTVESAIPSAGDQVTWVAQEVT